MHPTASQGSMISNSRWLALTGAGLILLIAAFLLDGPIDRWAAAHRNFACESAAKMCSRYLAWHWLMLGGVLGLLVAWSTSRREWARLLCAMMIAASLAGLAADFLRGATGRTRPYTGATQGWYGARSEGKWLITKHAYNSFPSGHASAMAGFAVPLLLWRRRLALLVPPVIAAVAAARVYLGAHHLSDVIAGALLGSVIALWVYRRINARRSFLERLSWLRAEA